MSRIGRSEEGRPLPLALLGAPGASLRLLLFAGQHGDEPEGRRALERLETLLTSEAALPADTQLAIVPDLNPDGAHRRQRRNARGIDLNRDHQLLRASETRAIHRYVREFRPHLIVDVHAYPPRRRHLLDRGLVYRQDVFLEIPTHPDALHSLALDECTKLLAGFEAALSQQGFHAGRYLLVRPGGRIRHGTLDVRDARNGLTLRYGVPTLLLEGRRSRRSEGPQRRTRAAAALDAALRHLIAWADASRTRLTAAPVAGSDDVGLRCRWSRGGANVGPLLFEPAGWRRLHP